MNCENNKAIKRIKIEIHSFKFWSNFTRPGRVFKLIRRNSFKTSKNI